MANIKEKFRLSREPLTVEQTYKLSAASILFAFLGGTSVLVYTIFNSSTMPEQTLNQIIVMLSVLLASVVVIAHLHNKNVERHTEGEASDAEDN